ncbi:hypothetical protein Drorol1_Dr00015291 [Drosera rotundifolia]
MSGCCPVQLRHSRAKSDRGRATGRCPGHSKAKADEHDGAGRGGGRRPSILAPGRCSSYMGNCTAGDSATDAHNLLLCHTAAVKLYKKKYQAAQKGVIGISIATTWYVPINKASESLKAAARANDFMFGCFTEPITYGHYPKTMPDIVGSRPPKFTKAQAKMLKGSIDFLGSITTAQIMLPMMLDRSYV